MRADYIAQSSDGHTLLAIEAKARDNFNRADANEVLHSYEESGLLDKTTYFCVITPKLGFLWRLRHADPDQFWEFPTLDLLSPYVPAGARVPPLEFEFAVGQMVRDLSDGSAIIKMPGELRTSGVLDVLRGARITGERAA